MTVAILRFLVGRSDKEEDDDDDEVEAKVDAVCLEISEGSWIFSFMS